MARMHSDEVETNVSLVRRLVATQFPQWADLLIEPVPSAGTDNTIYRLGTDMAVRLPRHQGSGGPTPVPRRLRRTLIGLTAEEVERFRCQL